MAFIDDANFAILMRALGLRKVNFSALYTLLQTQIGNTRVFYRSPMITVREKNVVNFLQRQGYDARCITSVGREEDDRLIINEIRNVSPDNVAEIILVSGDGSFYPVLKEKIAQGISVYIVSSGESVPREAQCIASVYYGDTSFHLVDIGEFRKLLQTDSPSPSRKTYFPNGARYMRGGRHERKRRYRYQ